MQLGSAQKGEVLSAHTGKTTERNASEPVLGENGFPLLTPACTHLQVFTSELRSANLTFVEAQKLPFPNSDGLTCLSDVSVCLL